MNSAPQNSCPVCQSVKQSFFITTHAMMHTPNSEQYVFNQCDGYASVFLTNRVEEVDLSKYYTDNYLPYRGYQAWGKFQSFVESSQRSLDQQRVKVVKQMIGKENALLSLLDVGCGKPNFLEAVQKQLPSHCPAGGKCTHHCCDKAHKPL